MRFKTKAYLFFVIVASIALTSAFSIMIKKGRQIAFDDIQTSAVTVANTTASLIDGDLVAQIKTAEDEKKPVYLELQKFLRKARDANRNDNVYIKFLYTIYPDPKDPRQFLFGIDAEETAKDVSHAGTTDPGATRDLLFDHLHQPYVPNQLQTDKWGTWLTGYAPILNSEGHYVASIGADISATFVYAVMRHLYVLAALSASFSLFLALLAAYFLADHASNALHALSFAAQEIDKGNFSYRVDVATKDEFYALGEAFNVMAQGLLEKERMKSGFAHCVSKHVMEKITTQGAPQIKGERRKLTVFFSAIRNFTAIAEKWPAEQVTASLNEYFQAMFTIVFKYNGMLDQCIGDAILAEFGFPEEDPEQEKHAVLTALELQQALAALRVQWLKEGKPALEIGIGIYTGEAIGGTVGDTTDIASRLEGAMRQYNEKIIVSETTLKALGKEFPSKSLGPIQLKGIEQPINAYAILSLE